MSMRAERKGDRYVLNGTKMWITNGPDADMLVVYAKTDPDGRRARHHRLPDREGHSRAFAPAQKLDKLGMRGSPTCELVFEDCEVPAENVLGPLERRRERADERPRLRARGAGRRARSASCRPAWTWCCPMCTSASSSASAIGEFQLMQGKLADMYTALNACRAYVYAVARACDRGRDHAQGCRRRDPLRRREGDADGAGGDPGARRQRLHQRLSRPAGCCATPSSTRSAPAPARSAAC